MESQQRHIETIELPGEGAVVLITDEPIDASERDEFAELAYLMSEGPDAGSGESDRDLSVVVTTATSVLEPADALRLVGAGLSIISPVAVINSLVASGVGTSCGRAMARLRGLEQEADTEPVVRDDALSLSGFTIHEFVSAVAADLAGPEAAVEIVEAARSDDGVRATVRIDGRLHRVEGDPLSRRFDVRLTEEGE